MQCIYLHVKHALNNIQGAQKISGKSSTSIDVPTENFLERKNIKQESFNACFADINGEDYWVVRLIQQTNNVESLRKRESFWQHEMDTFQPN